MYVREGSLQVREGCLRRNLWVFLSRVSLQSASLQGSPVFIRVPRDEGKQVTQSILEKRLLAVLQVHPDSNSEWYNVLLGLSTHRLDVDPTTTMLFCDAR